MHHESRSPRLLLGGGGFSTQSDPSLDTYVLGLTGKFQPSICFLPTASGDSDNYIKKFENRFADLPCRPSVLSLFRPHTADIEGFLLSMDVIYVGGGSTKNLLALWREWGVVDTLLRANKQGCVLAGVSAGLICWFDEGITDSEYGRLGPLACLGKMAGLACPHFDSETGRKEAMDGRFAQVNHTRGFGVQDGVALHFDGERFVEAVTSREGSGYFEYSRSSAEQWQVDFRTARLLD